MTFDRERSKAVWMVWFAVLVRWLTEPPDPLKGQLLESYQATFRPVGGLVVIDRTKGWEVLLLEAQRQLREQNLPLHQGYIVTIDGWWLAHPPTTPRAVPEELTEPSYRLWYRRGTIWDGRTLMTRADLTTHSRSQGCVQWAMPPGPFTQVVECLEDLETTELHRVRLELLQRDHRAEPHDPELVTTLADYHALVNDATQSQLYYRHRLNLVGEVVGQWYARWRLAQLAKDGARGHLQAAIKLLPDRAESHYQLGLVATDPRERRQAFQRALQCDYRKHHYRVDRSCYTYAALDQLSIALTQSGRQAAYFDEQLLRRFDVPNELRVAVLRRQATRSFQLSPPFKQSYPVAPRVPNYHATQPSLSPLPNDRYLVSVELVNFLGEPDGSRHVFDLDQQPRVVLQLSIIDHHRRQTELPPLTTPMAEEHEDRDGSSPEPATGSGRALGRRPLRGWQLYTDRGTLHAVAGDHGYAVHFRHEQDKWQPLAITPLVEPHHSYSIVEGRTTLTLLLSYDPLTLVHWVRTGSGESGSGYQPIRWTVPSRLKLPDLAPTGGVRLVKLPTAEAEPWWSTITYLSFANSQVDGVVVHRLVYHDLNLRVVAVSAPFNLTGHPTELIGGWVIVYGHIHILLSLRDRLVVWRVYTLRNLLTIPTVHYSVV